MKSPTVNGPTLRRQTLLRVMLLVALTFGVFGMHTFGHPPDLGRSAAGHMTTTAGHMTTAAHKIQPVLAPAQDLHGSHGHADGLHAFTVCLAVLSTLLVLVSLSMLRQRWWDLAIAAGARLWATGKRRAPPRRPIGLHLTAVSVLRT